MMVPSPRKGSIVTPKIIPLTLPALSHLLRCSIVGVFAMLFKGVGRPMNNVKIYKFRKFYIVQT